MFSEARISIFSNYSYSSEKKKTVDVCLHFSTPPKIAKCQVHTYTRLLVSVLPHQARWQRFEICHLGTTLLLL